MQPPPCAVNENEGEEEGITVIIPEWPAATEFALKVRHVSMGWLFVLVFVLSLLISSRACSHADPRYTRVQKFEKLGINIFPLDPTSPNNEAEASADEHESQGDVDSHTGSEADVE